jgi:hypothetical protein
LLAHVPEDERPDGAWRIHPLPAELLRREPGSEGGRARMTAWFIERLPALSAGQEAQQGQHWNEIQTEGAALVAWLAEVPDEDVTRVERAGSWYAIYNGPFQAWMNFCERGLAVRHDPGEHSKLLWTMAQVARAQTEAAGGDPRSLRRLSVQFRGMGVPEEEIVVSGTVTSRDGDRAIVATEAVQGGNGIVRNAESELELR